MPIESLDAAFVRKATCPDGKSKVDYYDSAITGFILEVRASGGKTFHLRYRDQHGKQRQHKIGDSKSISFDKARQAAQQLRSRVVLGDSPAEEKRIKRTVPTLNEFFEDRYIPFVKGYKKSWDSDESYYRNHLLKKFGGLHLDQITQQEVVEHHHALRAAGYAAATCNRVLVLLRYIYNMAAKWKVPGALANPTLGASMYELNNERERYLTPEETQKLRAALERSGSSQLKYIVPLLLMTGARKRELLDACWGHFDLERRSWRIPTSKSGKARHVPLSATVMEILNQLPRWEGCPYVVPNPKTKMPFRSVFSSWDIARKEAGMPELRMHDLRHSMASNMVNSGRSIYEVSKVLGHAQLKTTQRYSHLSQETLLAAVDAAADATGTIWNQALPAKTA